MSRTLALLAAISLCACEQTFVGVVKVVICASRYTCRVELGSGQHITVEQAVIPGDRICTYVGSNGRGELCRDEQPLLRRAR